MATKKTTDRSKTGAKNGRPRKSRPVSENGVAGVQGFVKGQLEDAQKRIATLEGEAEKTLRNLVDRGRASRKELEELLKKVNRPELNLIELPAVRQLSERAGAAGTGMRRRLDDLQSRLVTATGVATQAQVKELNRELSRLSKKIDGLVGKSSSQARLQ